MDDMTVADYLAQGGKLTSPANVPPRYRAELLKLMASFVDSEMAGSAGFADVINTAPGLRERIAAARIVFEKVQHAEKVLALMGEFGVNTARYANSHPWAERLPRDSDIGAQRGTSDMRLAVFNYPFKGWVDSVVMNLLMGRAVEVQLEDFQKVSYQPLAQIFAEIAPTERHHAALAAKGLARMVEEGKSDEIAASAAYWWPRVSASFGPANAPRAEALQAMGLRHRSGAEMRSDWENRARTALQELGIRAPA